MYSSLTSSSAQRAALRAVAATNLADEHNEVFEAILALFATAAKDRNKIAHWVWGHSPQIPEGVLLADPEGLIRYRAMLEEYIRGHSLNQNSRPVNPELPRDQIFVYYERDFAQQSEQIQRLISFVGRFGRLIASPASEDSAEEFQKLLNEPAILERVLRQRKHQRN